MNYLTLSRRQIFQNLWIILRWVDNGVRLSEDEVVWLTTGDNDYFTVELRVCYHKIEADYYAGEFKKNNAVSLTGSFVLKGESFLFNPMFSWEFSIWTDGFRSLNENSSQLFDKRSHFFCGSFK
jgi:hypothetical protein